MTFQFSLDTSEWFHCEGCGYWRERNWKPLVKNHVIFLSSLEIVLINFSRERYIVGLLLRITV